MTKIINLMPHTLNVELPSGERLAIEPHDAKNPARVDVKNVPLDAVAGIPVTTAVYGDVVGLLEPEDGVVYVVSMLVGSRVAGTRDDIYGPDSGPTAIRENGNVKAVRGLIKY